MMHLLASKGQRALIDIKSDIKGLSWWRSG